MSDQVTIVSVAGLNEAYLQQIREVGARLCVIDAGPVAEAYFQARQKGPEVVAAAIEDLRQSIAEGEILYGLRFDREMVSLMPRLRWVQAMTAGVDHLLKIGLPEREIRLTCSRIHRVQIGEYVLMMLLALTKRLPELLRAQAEHRWAGLLLDEIYEKTLGVVGLGTIGTRVAEIGKFLGMRVVACRRRPPEVEHDDLIDRWYPSARLREMLAECDYVVLAVPSTAETARLIGTAELQAMKPTAYLINIARGSVIDEAALVGALRDRQIAGPALDVFTKEPLPADSPLWDLPNVILTPHVSGPTPRYTERAVGLFRENLRRYLAGEPLLNEVDPNRGY